MIIIEVAGHLGSDAETRYTTSGQKVTTIRIATNIRKNGKEETVWWRVTMWGDRFDKILPYLKKGTAVIVIGEMSKAPEIYSDREGRSQISLEITAEIVRFSPFGRSDRANQEQGQAAGMSNNQSQGYGYAGNKESFSDSFSMSNMKKYGGDSAFTDAHGPISSMSHMTQSGHQSQAHEFEDEGVPF